MADARTEIMGRIRAALADGPAPTPVPRGYRREADPGTDVVALFAERAGDYRAVVERVPADGLPAAVARVLAGISRFVVPDGLPSEWLAELPPPTADKIVRDDPPLSARDLDRVFGVVTGCATAIAETGTVILDHGPGQGRRALTLVPDFHLVVVQAGQVEPDIAGALARLNPARPHTLISGPSATSDIELIRVEGVHGPRNLHILIAG